MEARFPKAARALLVLTAAGLLLSGCHTYYRAGHGGPYYAAPGHGYGHHYYSGGKGGRGDGHYYRDGRHGGRGGSGWR